MDQVRQRIHRFDQDYQRQSEQVRDQGRLRQMQQLREMNQAYGQMAEQARGNLKRLRRMEQDPALQRDHEMQRDMERLRLQLRDMSARLDEGVQTTERLRPRLPCTGGREAIV
jgi:hypothetical protein